VTSTMTTPFQHPRTIHHPRAAVALQSHWICTIALLFLVAGCDDMSDGSRQKPLEGSAFFENGQLARHPVEGTIPRELPPAQFTTTRGPDGPIDAFPTPVTRETLRRGQQRYNIYCAVCHGATGEGDGMIVRRGLTRPPSFMEDRLMKAPASHFVEVITNGYGAMYSYSDRVNPEDRWAITAYVRALQFSQRADIKSLPPADVQMIQQQQQQQQSQQSQQEASK
jgi:mono/diheme cytochrome c family protein